MTQLAGVWTRYPLLEPTLAKFTGTIPPRLKVKRTQLRYLFKKAMAEVLPREIIKKKKHGFGLPYAVWVGEDKPLKEFTFDLLGSSRSRQRGYFRSDLLEWLWSKYQTEHRGFYGEILWEFLMLEMWHLVHRDHLAGMPTAGETVQVTSV
jgi:asparagine synthase (glutamine-hydrolysing)